MRTNGPDHDDARILARIEAELRESDPQFPALFDKLNEAGRGQRPRRGRAKTQWGLLISALVPVLALVLIAALAGARPALWQVCPTVLGCPGITATADRAAAIVQAHTADLGDDIRAQICHSIPDGISACG